jgi:hypothetical protein
VVDDRLTEAETEAYLLLRKYRVFKHYRATSAAKATRYAVFLNGGVQISEPVTHAEAKKQADILTAKEIARQLGRAR